MRFLILQGNENIIYLLRKGLRSDSCKVGYSVRPRASLRGRRARVQPLITAAGGYSYSKEKSRVRLTSWVRRQQVRWPTLDCAAPVYINNSETWTWTIR